MKGSELKQIFLLNGWSQVEICSKIGESQQNFSSSLRSDNVKSGLIERVAEAMGVPVSFMYGEGPQIANASGKNSTAIAGNNINNSTDSSKLLDILADKEKQLTTAQEQINKLLSMLELTLK